MPTLKNKSKSKREQMVRNWEEVVINPNTVLEVEAQPAKYIWLLIQGEVTVYKRPESIYDEYGKPTDVKQIDLLPNPIDSNCQKFGMIMGTIKEENLLSDDSVVFNQPMMYSLKTKTQIIAWRCPLSIAQSMFP